jgi:hypothetical protein
MTNVKHDQAVSLFRKSIEAGNKVKRNASKLAFMDATRRMADAVILAGVQLESYEREAQAAAIEFSKFVNGWSTSEIVKVIEDAG